MLHESSLADAADRLWEELPGHRVGILNGSIVVTPPPDGSRQETLTWLVEEFSRAQAGKAGPKYLSGIALWLPTGPDDYAVPDFSLVEADFKDALVEKNCYAPHVFRLGGQSVPVPESVGVTLELSVDALLDGDG
ncbi:hypothetical protein ACF1A5_01995 [Streptomyces sp. NPDC014864]|uniref:hypothetical protein n=1 Tax=Streptomyces sp. NPDC014864 TaxID=3364924 RepID=UPI0036FF9344